YRQWWRKRNPEKIKKYPAKPSPARRRASRMWRENNPERAREYGEKWRKDNPHRIREYVRKYFKRREMATPPWSDRSLIQKIYSAAKSLPGYEVDHIIPLFGELVCGLHVPSNLQIVPKRHNRKKSNKF